MKYILLLLFMLASVNVFSQAPADETQIRAVIQTMEDSYNAHDYSFSGKYDILIPDACFINPVGMYWRNRKEIIQAVQALGKIRLKYESTKNTIRQIKFLVPKAAFVVVTSNDTVLEDYNFPDGSKGGSKGDAGTSMYSFTLTRIGIDWKIAFVQITHVDPNATAMNPVKDN